MSKTFLWEYLCSEGLNLITGTELVPLLRRCTDIKDGHLDLPKIVRHIVGLYYIVHIDPNWLFASLPLGTCSEGQRASAHYFYDVLSFYLFSPRPIRNDGWSKPIQLDWRSDRQIFNMVDKKLRHIIQSLKDDGDRANWKPGKMGNNASMDASMRNHLRLYGGNPEYKLQREALNYLRNNGRLITETLSPGQVSYQRKRFVKQLIIEQKLVEARDKDAFIAGLIEKHERELIEADGEVAVRKKETELAGLKKWQAGKGRHIQSLSRKLRIAERHVEDGKISFFYQFDELKNKNAADVQEYVDERGFCLRNTVNIPLLIKKNYDAGRKGKAYVFMAQELDNREFLPHRETSFYSVILLGAISAEVRTLAGIPLDVFALARKDKIQEELSRHGIIREAVLGILDVLYKKYRMLEEKHGEIIDQLRKTSPESLNVISYCHALSLLGVASPDEIKKLGRDYFEKSRKCFRSICKFEILDSDLSEHVHEAYRSVLDCSEVSYFVTPPLRLDADEAQYLRECYGWNDDDLACYGYYDNKANS